ncbi:MAG: hypothetical protein WKF37_07760 [Bryobacteraceae bacterium]
MYGALNLPLLVRRDIFSDCFRRALHRFGRNLQARQQFHLLAPALEGSLLAHQCQHAAHAGREFRILDIQFGVGRKLPVVTL